MCNQKVKQSQSHLEQLIIMLGFNSCPLFLSGGAAIQLLVLGFDEISVFLTLSKICAVMFILGFCGYNKS